MNAANLDKLIAHLELLLAAGNEKPFEMGSWYATERRSARDHREPACQGPLSSANPILPVTIYRPDPVWAGDLVAVMQGQDSVPEVDRFNCNTVACIAGHAALLRAAEPGATIDSDTGIRDYAMAWLGLTERQASRLFEPDVVSYDDVTLDRAIDTLKRFRATGRVKWEVATDA